MRLIRGETLQSAIEHYHELETVNRDPRERALAFQRLLRRFIDTCNTIGYAHSRGVLHRDIKPANIMLGKYGETLVIDWGLAKYLYRPDMGVVGSEGPSAFHPADFHGMTATGQIVGTPSYMSPEQAEGRDDLLEPTSNVYSLGATLYAILTGRAPFQGSAGHVLTSVRRGTFPRPREVTPDVPLELEAVCLKAMALKPEDRYVSAISLADDIERWFAGIPLWVRSLSCARILGFLVAGGKKPPVTPKGS